MAEGKTGDVLCLVFTVAAYMARREMGSGPFFVFPDGTTLTKSRFADITREAISELHAGLPQEQFTSHTFWIGAATAAAQTGLEDSRIN